MSKISNDTIKERLPAFHSRGWCIRCGEDQGDHYFKVEIRPVPGEPTFNDIRYHWFCADKYGPVKDFTSMLPSQLIQRIFALEQKVGKYV